MERRQIRCKCRKNRKTVRIPVLTIYTMHLKQNSTLAIRCRVTQSC